MTCECQRKNLIEVAAAGTEPGAELRDHLQACPSCQDAFNRERSLFASIDSCLQTSANAEIPSSFLPRVRALASKHAPPRTPVDTARMVFAIAAAAIVLLCFAQFGRRTKLVDGDKSLAKRETSPAVVPLAPREEKSRSVSPLVTASVMQNRSNKSSAEIYRNSRQPDSREPEIIVPGDQEVLLARYADHLRHRRNSPRLVTTETDPTQTAPLQVDLIQIAQLDVKPLAERQE